MPPPVTRLENQQTFRFTCAPEVPCFNACCRDLNQVLTPYDVLCLKNHLGMTSTDFLATYTQMSTGPESGLPVISLRFDDDQDLACPFVTAAGCRVYSARPASCRTYPLARGVSRDRKTGRLCEHWAVIREPHCQGFENGPPQTVSQWVDDQQIAAHNRMNDRMLELISAKNRLRPGILPPSEANRVYTALYDLDAFRRDVQAQIADQGTIRLPEGADIDDEKLLCFAMDWVCKQIFEQVPASTGATTESNQR